MKSMKEILREPRLAIIKQGADSGIGMVYLNGTKKPASVVFSWGGGWEHVSVSYPKRMPTWDEMCKVKDIFWHEEECAVQYHPPKSEYVNIHQYCLHLWRKAGENPELPPKKFV